MKALVSQVLQTQSRDRAPVALRLALGLVITGHGAQKLFGWWGGYGLEGTAGFFAGTLGLTPGIFWAALVGSGEFFGGLALLAGFATRFFALNTAIIMAVALLTVHRGAFFLSNNGMEYPLTLLLVSVALIFTGGGAFSVDARLAPAQSRSS